MQKIELIFHISDPSMFIQRKSVT